MTRLLFILGTRPEAIKLAPLISRFRQAPSNWSVEVCVTGQHRQLIDPVLEFFDLRPEYDLKVMRPDQSLFSVSAAIIHNLERVMEASRPDCVFVQGDTTTAFLGALGGFYKRSKIAHIEAGLRSHDKYSPYPEELNRQLVGRMADFHFAPTEAARQNLHDEGVQEGVWVVGNTVIDALHLGLNSIRQKGESR